MLKNYKAINGQSIYDVCLQTYGTLDYLVKLLEDSGEGQGVNDIPVTGQQYIYDDALVVNPAVNQAFNLSGIIYATLLGDNGSTYYVIKQKIPKPVGGKLPPLVSQPNPDDMAIIVEGTQYVSNADGTTVISPTDKNGNSMAGGAYVVAQLELEIRPLNSGDWVWNPTTGVLTLTNGAVVDNGQTLFILYNKTI